jgi:2-keto-4-pentenoate hydratase/2-oxohepta-3-ene-1,7-dioic acid hydratase in catechol pathway
MKIVRFLYQGVARWGVLQDSGVRFLTHAPYNAIARTSQYVPYNEVSLLVPAEPTKIILVGLNYKDHAKELGFKIPKEPIIFLKPPTSCVAHNKTITYPREVRRLDYEAELAVVIKKQGKQIKESRVRDYILGYTCLNDVTARDLQAKDGQWTRAKSFDTFCPIGPWIETECDPGNLMIRLYLNRILKQRSSTKNFIFSIPVLISFISGIMTLMPGDVISTGTPSGVGAMKRGDRVSVEIEGVGILSNRVV